MTRFRWTGRGLAPGEGEEPHIVDSYLVRDGRVVGLSAHEQRFAGSVQAETVVELLVAVRETLPTDGAWFPRVEWYGGEEFGLMIRPAPSLRNGSSLWLSDLADPRGHPTVKGPDLKVLTHLRNLAVDYRCDDALLIDVNGVVLEAANAAVAFWEDPETVILPDRPVLPSVTVQQTIPLWENAGITVVRRDIRQLNLPAWCASSLHGWTPVTHWGRGAGKITAAPAPSVERWNQALWDGAERF